MSSKILSGLLLAILGQGGAKAYPRPELLIEASELAKPEVAKKFRILDTRSAKESKAARIPFSTNIDVAAWNKSFTAGPDAAFWEKELGRLGIDREVPIVVYGDDVRE